MRLVLSQFFPFFDLFQEVLAILVAGLGLFMEQSHIGLDPFSILSSLKRRESVRHVPLVQPAGGQKEKMRSSYRALTGGSNKPASEPATMVPRIKTLCSLWSSLPSSPPLMARSQSLTSIRQSLWNFSVDRSPPGLT